MKKWLFTFLLLIVFPVMASHIMGGEFELLHISGNRYRLNLIIYFDLIHADTALIRNKDPFADAAIFRKSDNKFMKTVRLFLASDDTVGYTQPVCSHGEIKTSRQIYTNEVLLPDNTYNDPEGYYVSWQRCCRNYQITNIFSDKPPPFDPHYPTAAGQTFYLEFPPVVKDGQPFYNSSPRLFPPLNDFACPGKPYYVDFAGTDDDGDSVVYSMVDPLNTTSSQAVPAPAPGPYPPIRWKGGFGLDNIMYGQPDLRISPAGLLTCTPTASHQGLYVFAVKVEQFRDHVKIGESRRDFQMLVVDGCQPAKPPKILGQKITDPQSDFDNTMSVSFSNTVGDDNRCIHVRVSDPDSQSALYDSTQHISIRAIAIGFSNKDVSGILPAVTTGTLKKGSAKDFSICFPRCPYINGPFQIGIIASDTSCTLPLTDTLVVTVNIEPPVNNAAHFTTSPPNTVLNEGQSTTLNWQATDADGDPISVLAVTDGFLLANAGMTFNILNQQPGLVSGTIHWDAYCDIYDFTKRTNFQVKIFVNDIDQCNLDQPVAAGFPFTVKLPGVAEPIVDTNPHDYAVNNLERKINESLSFDVLGTQADQDVIWLNEVGGLNLTKMGISFPPVTATGAVTSHFQWDINCDNVDLKKKDEYDFHFVLVDSTNKCRVIKTDTVTVHLKVLPPDNLMPELTIQNKNQAKFANNTVSITMGESISLNLLGTDADTSPSQDDLTLQLIDASGNVAPAGYTFDKATGVGHVQSPFTWDPDCSIFENGVYQNEYKFKFSVADSRCFNAKADTVTLTIDIRDVDKHTHPFSPANIITPNGDGCNDYFAVEGFDPGCGMADPDEFIALPFDNCTGRFQFVRIHNRWGKLVYESTERNFRWYATNEAAGVYYYVIQFSNSEYKGVLSINF